MANILYEVIDRRTETAKHWRLDDGSYQAVISADPVHYTDSNGVLQNLDTSIVDPVAVAIPKQPISKTLHDNGGWAHSNHFTVPYNKVDVRLPKNIKSGYAVGYGPDRLTYTPQNASPSLGQINPTSSNEIDYQDVWVDTDLNLSVSPNGVKETLTLKSDRSPTTFTFKVDGPLASDFTSGALTIESPWYQDANGTIKSATMAQRVQGNQTFLDITIDPTGLAYPITLDPTTTLNASQAAGTASNMTPGATVAFQNVGHVPSPAGDGRAFAKFNLSSIPAGSAIASGTYQSPFPNGGNYATGAVNVPIYRLTQDWGTQINWSGPTYDASTAVSISIGSSAGTYQWPITNYVQNWFSGAWANYGIGMINDGQGLKTFSNPQLVVTYNQPPGAPTVTAPNGGETINTTFNITWTAATDPDTAQSSLVYQIDLSTDNGATWTTIVSQTAAGATSYNYDFTNTAQSSTCLIRIRAYDGTAYGPYDQSNGVFTVQHDQAPTAPTNLAPANNGAVDRTQAITATWQFNDPDTGDSQSKFNIKWSKDSGSTWTEVDGTVTPNTSYTWPANTFNDGDTVQWMVQTYDQSGLNSPWSAQAQFTAHNPTPAPTITDPAAGATVATANPTIQWSASGQAGYELQIRDTNGTSLYDEQHSTSTNTAQTLTGYNLANNTNYEIALRVLGSSGLWSPWAVNNVSVSYTPPAQATTTATPDNANARITVSIVNPAPTGTEPNVTSNDLLRRNTGGTSWTRIATGLAAGTDAAPTVYEDYAVASGQNYDYKITSYGSNGTLEDSTIVSNVSVGQLRGLWVHDVKNPSGTILNMKYMNNASSSGGTTPNGVALQHAATTLQFAGRSLPNVEFGESYSFTLTKGKIVLLDTDGQWPQIEEQIRVNKPTFCFRDGRGRMIFGSVTAYNATDMIGGTQVDLVLTQTSYSMAV